MEFLFAIVMVVVMTVLAGFILDKLHPATSSLDFANNDAYFAHLEKRDRFFREEHLGFAALNTVVAVAVASALDWGVLLPTLALTGATFVSWCAFRFFHRRPDQMVLWDKVDMNKLFASLAIGIAAAVMVALATSVGLTALWPVSIFVIAWLLLFPL
jgi:hypothetical protein